MTAAAGGFDDARIARTAADVGALPDAPLAMPKQRLEGAGTFGQALVTLVMRTISVRARSSRG